MEPDGLMAELKAYVDRLAYRARRLKWQPVGDVMSRNLLTVEPATEAA